jgi:hypothetical protein
LSNFTTLFLISTFFFLFFPIALLFFDGPGLKQDFSSRF